VNSSRLILVNGCLFMLFALLAALVRFFYPVLAFLEIVDEPAIDDSGFDVLSVLSSFPVPDGGLLLSLFSF
jgi:hypothetical protein